LRRLEGERNIEYRLGMIRGEENLDGHDLFLFA